MAKSPEDSIKWCPKKAEEYLQSAQENIRAKRLFPARARFGVLKRMKRFGAEGELAAHE